LICTVAGKMCDFLLDTLGAPMKRRCAPRKDIVRVQILVHIEVNSV
jgi:hypothetical protein